MGGVLMGDRLPGYRCPRCTWVSYNPNDIREGYCGHCHDWTAEPADTPAPAEDGPAGRRT